MDLLTVANSAVMCLIVWIPGNYVTTCINWVLTSWGRKDPHLNKENEMLEGSVEVSLLLQLHHRVKVLVVDVSIDPEQTLQDGFGHRHEVLWKRDSCRTVKNKNEII